MSSRDLERVARSFVAQKLSAEYILHYLMETYQLDLKTAQGIIAKVTPSRGGKHGGMSSDSVKIPVVRRRFQ